MVVREFTVEFSSFEDVVEFNSIATVQPFRIITGNDTQWVNAKSLMGLVALDHSAPMRVRMDCTPEQYEAFRSACKGFRAT